MQTKRLLRTSVTLNLWKSYGYLKIAILYGEYMKPGCIRKYNTNNLPARTNLTENTYGKKNLFLKMQLKNRLRWFYLEL
jgi:hypothetical protein